MKAVVVGVGKVGFELARKLAEEGHDVVLIDQNDNVLKEADEHLDVQILTGNGASLALLEEASVRHSDLFIAVTDIDEVNIVSCMIAKKIGAKRTVARLRETVFGDSTNGLLTSKDLGIDLIAKPEEDVAYHIVKLLRAPAATEVEYLAGGKVQMLGFRIQDGSPLAHKTIEQAKLAYCTIGAILRDGDTLVPQGSTRLYPGDEIFIIGKTGVPSEVGWLVGSTEQATRDVVIAGGGKTGELLARFLEKHWRHGPRVKIIERDKGVCEKLSRELSHTLIIHGDATKPDVLHEEGVHAADVFVALTGHDQANLLMGFMTKRSGTRRVVAKIEREDYAPTATQMGIDTTVVPRVIVAGAILRLIHTADIKSLSYINEGKLELIEMIVPRNCAACGKSIRHLGLPKGVVVGALIRGDKVIVPRGDTVLTPADCLVVFAASSALPSFESIFKD